MTVLLRLLTAPVTGPVRGTRWAIDAVLRAAEEAQEQDRARLAAEISELRRAHARGEVGDAELDRRIRPLLDGAIGAVRPPHTRGDDHR